MQNKHVKGPDHPTPFAMGTAEHDSTAGGMFLSGPAQACSSIVSTEQSAAQAAEAEADAAPKAFMAAPAGWAAHKISVDLHLADEINAYSTSQALGQANFYSQLAQAQAQLVPPVLLEASPPEDTTKHPGAHHANSKRVFSEADFALEYVPREEWGGHREGFVFRLGAQGQGYYKDTYNPQQHQLYLAQTEADSPSR